jgi:AcrR family transcriptional regulator
VARTRSKHFPDNQSLILDRAAELFARLGFHRASIAELAQECNYSKASLYHYYDSKEAILFALLDQHLDELSELADEAMAKSADPVEQFQHFVKENMRLYVNKVHHHVVLNRDMRYLPPELHEHIRHKARTLVARVSKLLREIRPELAKAPGNDTVYAMLFYGMLNWTYTWYDPKGSIGAEQFAHMAADLYLHGLCHVAIPALGNSDAQT